MPAPTTISGAREFLESTHRAPSANRPGVRTRSDANLIRSLNRQAGFTRTRPFQASRGIGVSPRPVYNTIAGRSAINSATQTFNRAATSRPVQAVTNRLPAPASVARFAASPVGQGAISAGTILVVGALDGDLSGQDVANAAGAGIGATAGTYAGAAIGALAGPVGSAVGAYVGGTLGSFAGQFAAQSLFPDRNGPAEDYSALESAPFTGGQGNGVQYRIESQGRTSVDGTVRIAPPTPNVTTGTGPIGYYYPDTTENTEGITLVDRSGQIVANVRVSSGDPETKLTAEFIVLNIDRTDGQPDTDGNADGAPRPVQRGTTQAQQNQSGVNTQPQGPQINPLVAAPALIPALAPTPQTQQAGPGPATPTRSATNPSSITRRASRPRSANPLDSQNNRNSPPPPTRTRTRSNCGCNRGILNGVRNLFASNGLTAGNTALLTRIDSTTRANNSLGSAIFTRLAAMQTFAEKAWKNTHIDKLMNMLTLVTVLHNGAMISRDIGETLGYVLSNALSVIGVTDEDDNPLDINQLVGESVTDFIKNVVGEDVYDDVRTSWQKANRVLQAGSNIIWTIRNISDTTSDLLEWTAENTGKIGNALKKYGVVGERSYPWMSERARVQDAYRNKLSRVFRGLESVEDTADSLAVVTSNVREIQEEVTELGAARNRFTEAVSQFGPEDTPDLPEDRQLPTSSPQNDPIAVVEGDAIEASKAPLLINLAADGQKGDSPDDAIT